MFIDINVLETETPAIDMLFEDEVMPLYAVLAMISLFILCGIEEVGIALFIPVDGDIKLFTRWPFVFEMFARLDARFAMLCCCVMELTVLFGMLDDVVLHNS